MLVCVSLCVSVCVRQSVGVSACGECGCVIGVLCRFQLYFCHITTVAACCMRRDSARVLSAANTDTPCHTHNTRVHNLITLS